MLDTVGPVRDDRLRTRVEGLLLKAGIVCEMGAGSFCPTGEEYQELLITARTFENLYTAMAGALLAFSDCSWREKCYWRVAPDYEEVLSTHDTYKQDLGTSHRGYVRFKITNKAARKAG